jgi:hypothetical protein
MLERWGNSGTEGQLKQWSQNKARQGLARKTTENMNLLMQKERHDGHWWLTPVILTTWEAEIRRIAVQSQHRQIVPKTYLKNTQYRKGLEE